MDIQKCFRKDGVILKEASILDTELLEKIRLRTEYLEDVSFSERLYHITYGLEAKPLCSGSQPLLFVAYRSGYRSVCALKGCVCKKRTLSEESRKSGSEKRQATMLERYGVRSISKLPGVAEKISESKKRGAEAWVKKMQTTMIERYGSSSTLGSPELREKVMKTNLERYGSEHISQVPQIREQIRQSCQERYGHANPMQNADIRDKVVQTCQERYGYENPMQNLEIQEKTRQTNLERYGCLNPAQIRSDTETNREFFLKLRSEEFWKSFDTREQLEMVLSKRFLSAQTILEYIQKNRPDLLGEYPRCSAPHRQILRFLESVGVEFEINTRKYINPYELDIVIPSKNLAIEVNGLYWHSEIGAGKTPDYHLQKTLRAEAVGLGLMQFWDSEIRDQRSIVESVIRARLGLLESVGARECQICEVDQSEEKTFLDENHLQGYVSSQSCVGLRYQNRLVALMSFRRPRFDKVHDWELLRFCTQIGLAIPGGASRLFEKRPTGSMISYADRRLFSGQLYQRLGFRFSHFSRPGYRYTQDYQTAFSRYRFQKSQLEKLLEVYDPRLSEWQNMSQNGWDRVWDCGQSVWVI